MASTGPVLSLHPNAVVYQSDAEDELEVDELDSDSEPEGQADPSQPTTKTNSNSLRPGERAPGHTLLAPMRLENMITSEGVTGHLALSKEGLYVLSIATEEFIKRLIQAGHREASVQRKSIISYNDMAMTTHQYQEFMFLHDTIPAPVTLVDALMLRDDKARELLEGDPAMASGLNHSSVPSPDPEPTMYSAPRPAKKNRSVNGREKANGSGSTSSKRHQKKPVHGPLMDEDHPMLPPHDWVPGPYPDYDAMHMDHHSGRNGLTSASAASAIPPPPPNGYPGHGNSRSATPPYPREEYSDEESLPPPSLYPETHSHSTTPPYPPQDDPSWPGHNGGGQFTGPASGFLQNSAPAFGRTPQNPGRTIYSHNHRPD